jgi:hypothetical protein
MKIHINHMPLTSFTPCTNHNEMRQHTTKTPINVDAKMTKTERKSSIFISKISILELTPRWHLIPSNWLRTHKILIILKLANDRHLLNAFGKLKHLVLEALHVAEQIEQQEQCNGGIANCTDIAQHQAARGEIEKQQKSRDCGNFHVCRVRWIGVD